MTYIKDVLFETDVDRNTEEEVLQNIIKLAILTNNGSGQNDSFIKWELIDKLAVNAGIPVQHYALGRNLPPNIEDVAIDKLNELATRAILIDKVNHNFRATHLQEIIVLHTADIEAAKAVANYIKTHKLNKCKEEPKEEFNSFPSDMDLDEIRNFAENFFDMFGKKD